MKLILGIDEVGRGPWAGPLVVGACVLRPRYNDSDEIIATEEWQNGLKDSKKLSAKKREELDAEIREKALGLGLGWVSAEELDTVGLSRALALATRRAVDEVVKKSISFDEIIIDGTRNFLMGTEYEEQVSVLKKADDKIKEVSAASILAKVARDNYMKEISKKYPEYGFESHVGYGTAKHTAALADHGICPEHRKSFRPVAKYLDNDTSGGANTEVVNKSKSSSDNKTTTAAGRKAEAIVAEYLTSELGHKILARNFRTKFYEIDIVSATADHIYFTEVKYRRTDQYGDPVEFIDKKKLERMTFAANSFMQRLTKKMPGRKLPSPVLAVGTVEGEKFQFRKWFVLGK